MNTIDELRATLAEHADIHDNAVVGRSDAVAGRVRAVRRRRRTAAAGGAVAVVVGAVGVALLPDAGPPERTLLGVTVPETMTATGYTYEYAEGVEGERGQETVTVRLPESDVPRLVSWATAGDGQDVEVSHRWSEPFSSGRPDFTDYVWVPAGERDVVRVTSDERVALAVFELSDTPPAGHTEHGVTFRQDVATRDLLAADVGAPGESEIALSTTLADGVLTLAHDCISSVRSSPVNGPQITVEIDGRVLFRSGCTGGADPSASDPAAQRATFDRGLRVGPRTYWPGDEITLTARLTDADGDAWPDAAGWQLMLAAYSDDSDSREVLGVRLDEVVEAEGHTWRLHSVAEGRLGSDLAWQTEVPALDERVYAGMVYKLDRNRTVALLVDGEELSQYAGGRTGIPDVGAVEPGRTVGLTARTRDAKGDPAGAEGSLVAAYFYELVE